MGFRRFPVLLAGFATAVTVVVATPAGASPAPIVPGHTTPPAGGTVSRGEGVDANGDGAQLGETLGAGVRAAWAAAPPECPQAAGSEVATVGVTPRSVVALDEQYQCAFVSAYALTTGTLQWRRQYHFARQAVVVGSAVYVVHDGSDGLYLDDLAATSGALRWTKRVDADAGEQYAFSVGAGVVADDIWVASAATGAPHARLVTQATSGTTDVRGGELLYNDNPVQAFSAADGHLLWTHAIDQYPGPGGGFPVLHGGKLYYPGRYGTVVLDPATGRQLRVLPPTDDDLAVDGPVGIFGTGTQQGAVAGTVAARSLADGTLLWRTALPKDAGAYAGPSNPVIANGLVWLTIGVDSGTPGRLLALDEVTGAVRTNLPLTCAPGAGPTVAQHHVVVPTLCGVQVFA